MAREAARVAAAGVLVAVACLLAASGAHARSNKHGGSSRPCRYRMAAGETQTITSSSRPSGRDLFLRSSGRGCSTYSFTCYGGYLVVTFNPAPICSQGALVVTYDSQRRRVCGKNAPRITTRRSLLSASYVSRRGGSGRGQGSGGHGGGHGSNGGHSGHSGSYKFTVKCVVVTTTTTSTTTTTTTTTPPTTTTTPPTTTTTAPTTTTTAPTTTTTAPTTTTTAPTTTP